MTSILLVDDEPFFFKPLQRLLSDNGYEVRLALNGQMALQEFARMRPNLVLLDIMMPEFDGYDTCVEMRKLDREVPIVFLSAVEADENQVRGLEVGGDDFVSKAASDEVLLARIRRALSRAAHFATVSVPESLTRTESSIYRLLKSGVGRSFSYLEIMSAAFGAGYVADERTVRAHISNLRKKLPAGESIQAKRGIGFALFLSA